MAVTVTWSGHATFLIDTGSGVLLVDPFFDECPTAAFKAADIEWYIIEQDTCPGDPFDSLKKSLDNLREMGLH